MLISSILAKERETKIISRLRALGVYDFVYWISWIFVLINVALISAGICAFVASNIDWYFFNQVDNEVIFRITFCYLLNMIGFACFTSTICYNSSRQTAMVM